MTKWDKQRFSVYDSEEKQVLGLVKELGEYTNKALDTLDIKTDLNGDHKGSWQGLSKPTLSEEGMRATVEKHVEDIKELSTSIENITLFANDENSLINAIALSRIGGTIQLTNDINITKKIVINKEIVFDGCGHKLICMSNGLHDWFYVSANKVEIINTSFDDNLKGRVIIAVNNTNYIKIKNCYFTGYSKEYGYYKTDSLVRLDIGVKNAFIEDCIFEDSGYQYDHSTENLNRCISFNDVNNEVGKVKNTIFRRVNQAMVSVIKNLSVENCIFDNVKDNSVYTSGEVLKVTNCDFTNSFDEPIVSASKTNVITNNMFNGFNNKCVCFAGTVISSIVTGNTFINTNGSQCLGHREGLTIKSLIFSNNTLSVASANNYLYPIVTTIGCQNFIMTNNFIETSQAVDSNIIRVTSELVTFTQNVVKQISGQYPVRLLLNDNASAITTFNNNMFSGCRNGVITSSIGSTIEPNASYLSQQNTSGIFFSTQAPTYNLPKGTIVFNTNYSGGKPAFWISMGTQWVGQKPEISV